MKDFDFKDLFKRLEANGMPMLEDTAKTLVNTILDWAQDSITKSENRFDDFILPVLPIIRKYALGYADKIAEVKITKGNDVASNDETKDEKAVDGGQLASNVPELGALPMA